MRNVVRRTYSSKILKMKTLFALFFLCLPFVGFSQKLPPTYPSHYFSFTETDSISYPTIYPDQTARDSIADSYRNAHRRAKAIEKYALNKQEIDFLNRIDGDQDQWSLTLTNDKKIKVGPRPGSHVVDYNFEYYHPSTSILVFRVQWTEGNNYVLVSRKTGSKIETYGPPIFSPSEQYFISYNGVEFTSYNKNGIQLFKLTKDGIEKLIDYSTDLAPSRIKWKSDSTFALEMYNARPVQYEGMVRTYQHYQTAIKATK